MKIAGLKWPVWVAGLLAVALIAVWVINQGGQEQPIDSPQQPLPPAAPDQNGPDQDVPGGPGVPGIPGPGGSYFIPEAGPGRDAASPEAHAASIAASIAGGSPGAVEAATKGSDNPRLERADAAGSRQASL
jgi:hypothetical protein